MTVLLYISIGPLFAIPRTASVSFEVGIAPFLTSSLSPTVALALFSLLFFGAALFFSLYNTKILTWVGKILNPLFLLFLSLLIVVSLVKPMGTAPLEPVAAYQAAPFVTGFIAGYQTMDAMASLAFGIIVVQTLQGLGVQSPQAIARGTVKAGAVSMACMAVIYSCLTYMGVTSARAFGVSANGGRALALIARHYFGAGGGILLALVITLACLKTAVGLITACSETFVLLFPRSFNYRAYVCIFTAVSLGISNVGLSQIISLSLPVLMFLYPFTIALIVLGLLSPLFKNRRGVYLTTILCIAPISIGDFFQALPVSVQETAGIRHVLSFFDSHVPLFTIGMGWLLPLVVGLGGSWLWALYRSHGNRTSA